MGKKDRSQSEIKAEMVAIIARREKASIKKENTGNPFEELRRKMLANKEVKLRGRKGQTPQEVLAESPILTQYRNKFLSLVKNFPKLKGELNANPRLTVQPTAHSENPYNNVVQPIMGVNYVNFKPSNELGRSMSVSSTTSVNNPRYKSIAEIIENAKEASTGKGIALSSSASQESTLPTDNNLA